MTAALKRLTRREVLAAGTGLLAPGFFPSQAPAHPVLVVVRVAWGAIQAVGRAVVVMAALQLVVELLVDGARWILRAALSRGQVASIQAGAQVVLQDQRSEERR